MPNPMKSPSATEPFATVAIRRTAAGDLIPITLDRDVWSRGVKPDERVLVTIGAETIAGTVELALGGLPIVRLAADIDATNRATSATVRHARVRS